MDNKKTKKGFTLMEMIIVLAIIAVLSAILVPAWSYFMRRAHERDAAAKAKVVFNAAQTEITKIGMKERTLMNIINDPTMDSDRKDNARKEVYVGDGEFYFYWDGTSGVKVDSSGVDDDVVNNQANNAKLARGINTITGGTGIYKIYVKNYNVESVMYSDMDTSRYKGTYPMSFTTITDNISDATWEGGRYAAFDPDAVRSGSVKLANLKDFNLSGT